MDNEANLRILTHQGSHPLLSRGDESGGWGTCPSQAGCKPHLTNRDSSIEI